MQQELQSFITTNPATTIFSILFILLASYYLLLSIYNKNWVVLSVRIILLGVFSSILYLIGLPTLTVMVNSTDGGFNILLIIFAIILSGSSYTFPKKKKIKKKSKTPKASSIPSVESVASKKAVVDGSEAESSENEVPAPKHEAPVFVDPYAKPEVPSEALVELIPSEEDAGLSMEELFPSDEESNSATSDQEENANGLNLGKKEGAESKPDFTLIK